jgi:hypothetical protein
MDMVLTKIQYRGLDYIKAKATFLFQTDGTFLAHDKVVIKRKDFKHWKVIRVQQ